MATQLRSQDIRDRIRVIGVACVAVLASSLSAAAFAQTDLDATADGPVREAPASRIETLMTQKRDLLKRRYSNVKGLSEAGNDEYTISDAYDAEMDLLEAELDLAATPDERLSVLEAQLANRRAVEEHLRPQFEHTMDDPFGVRYFKASADRIDAELALAREVLRQPAGNPRTEGERPGAPFGGENLQAGRHVSPSPDVKARTSPAKQMELTVDFAPKVSAVIVTGNDKDITKAIELLQASNLWESDGPRMTVNFFPDLDFGHISIRGERGDVEQIKQLVQADGP